MRIRIFDHFSRFQLSTLQNANFRANMLVQGQVGAEILQLDHFGPHYRIPRPHIGLDAPQPVTSSKEAFSEGY